MRSLKRRIGFCLRLLTIASCSKDSPKISLFQKYDNSSNRSYFTMEPQIPQCSKSTSSTTSKPTTLSTPTKEQQSKKSQ